MAATGFKIALVGASTLKGKELKEVLEERRFPVRHLSLLDEEDLVGQLTEFQGEPAFVRSVEMGSFEGGDFAFFASSPLFTRNHWKLAEREGCRVIDVSEGLEQDLPEAPVAAPFITGQLPPAGRPAFVAAHPAALVIALVIRRLAATLPLARVIVNVFEPASERGQAGVEELHQQTVNLLTFKEWPRQVFEGQSAFNMLPALGEGARPTLLEVEARVARQVAQILGAGALTPSLRVAQASSFHAHSFSFYLEMAQARPPAELQRALSAPPFDFRGGDVEAPSAVGAAASSEVLVGDLRVDASSPRGYWLWAAADNLRLMAVNAVETAELLAGVKV
jgi:aspartate-semialdehyde dehydrogenase